MYRERRSKSQPHFSSGGLFQQFFRPASAYTYRDRHVANLCINRGASDLFRKGRGHRIAIPDLPSRICDAGERRRGQFAPIFPIEGAFDPRLGRFPAPGWPYRSRSSGESELRVATARRAGVWPWVPDCQQLDFRGSRRQEAPSLQQVRVVPRLAPAVHGSYSDPLILKTATIGREKACDNRMWQWQVSRRNDDSGGG